MQHSVKFIGEQYERLSQLRNEKNPFNAEAFFKFAKENSKKYSIIENGDDLLVSTWYSDQLIEDYQSTLKKKLLWQTGINFLKNLKMFLRT